jgi:iron complex outermembrane receptor protein
MVRCQLVTRFLSASIIGIVAYLLCTAPLQAQVAPSDQGGQAASENGGFEELVVTARKRSEAVQTVPIAITAFTQQDLENKNIATIQDLRYETPSVYIFADSFRQDTVDVTIRGMQNFNQGTGISYDTAAAIYIDGIYYARTQGLSGTFYDVSNVAVLEGPQGTLVGRNSTGGAVLYTTMQPQDTFGGFLEATVGDYQDRTIQGALNVPITDKIDVRIAGSYDGREGYLQNIYYNPTTGYRNDTAALGYRKLAGRVAVKFQPDDDMTITLRGDTDTEHDTGSSYHDLGYFVGTVASLTRPSICNIPGTCTTSTATAGTGFTDLQGNYIAPYYANGSPTSGALNSNPAAYNALLNSVARQKGNFWTTDAAQTNWDTDHIHTVSATVDDTHLDNVEIKLLGGYHWMDTEGIAASRGDPYITLDGSYDSPGYKSYDAELTFNGKLFDDRLKWTTGLFFFDEEQPMSYGNASALYSPNYPVPSSTSGHQITLSTYNGTGQGQNYSYAGYAQATYSILPELRVTGGIRYSVDDREAATSAETLKFPATSATAPAVYNSGYFVYNGIAYKGYSTSCSQTNAAGVVLPLSQCYVHLSHSFEKPTFTFSVDYDVFDKTLVYFTTSRGYRAGAVIPTAVPQFDIIQPETAQDYEVGIKSDWEVASIPFRTNGDVYDTQFNNVQTTVALPGVLFATAPGTGPGGTTGPCTQAAFNAGSCAGTTNSSVALNAKAARIYGAEASITAKPVPELTLTVGGDYLHAYYTNFSFTVPPGYLLPAAGGYNLSGTPFPLPQRQINASATYTLSGEQLGLPVGSVSVGGQIYAQSHFMADTQGFNSAQTTQGYLLTDFRVNIVNILETNLDLSGFVTNAFNTQACQPESGNSGSGAGAGLLNSVPTATFGTPGTSGVIQCIPLPPRMFGVTAKYTFGAPPAPPEAPKGSEYTPPPVVAATPSVPHSYMVFFDFNKSDLTAQATAIVDQAAKNAGPAKATQINVTGHTDTVGSDAYNMRLSRRRAESVAAELEKQGISSSEIEIIAKGKQDLLVPTKDGVREPQNRRVTIVYAGSPTS